MNFYVSLFPGAEVFGIIRYGPNGPGAEGSVMEASFRIGSQTVLCTDSFVKQIFSFTPSISLFVECESEAENRRLYAALVAGGAALMLIASYGFSNMFGLGKRLATAFRGSSIYHSRHHAALGDAATRRRTGRKIDRIRRGAYNCVSDREGLKEQSPWNERSS